MTTVNKSGIGGLTGQPATQKSEETSSAKKANTTAKGIEAANQGAAKSNDKAGVAVQLSNSAQEISKAHRRAFEIAKATPEVREDRVADLKKRIESGEYKADSSQIADGIMREALMEQLALTPDE
jgi:flagellar biosynthesis anti-sigma factor FlgM